MLHYIFFQVSRRVIETVTYFFFHSRPFLRRLPAFFLFNFFNGSYGNSANNLLDSRLRGSDAGFLTRHSREGGNSGSTGWPEREREFQLSLI